MLLNLDFTSNIVLSCFFLFYLYFLIPAVIAQIFNLIAELVAPIGIPIKEAKVEMETHLGILEIAISTWSI